MTADPAIVGRTLGEQRRGGRAHADEPALGHLEDADLARRAEPVLDRAHDPKRVVAIALEVEDGVDHVLEDPRSRNRAVLGHVSHQQRGHAQVLGDPHQPSGTSAHLADAPGRTGEFRVEGGLNRVDHQHAGLTLAHRFLDGGDVEFGQQGDAVRRGAEPPCAQADLLRATPRRTRRARRFPRRRWPRQPAGAASTCRFPAPRRAVPATRRQARLRARDRVQRSPSTVVSPLTRRQPERPEVPP